MLKDKTSPFEGLEEPIYLEIWDIELAIMKNIHSKILEQSA